MTDRMIVREVAVLHWSAELAAARARYDLIDARFRRGQGSLSAEAWSTVIEIHLAAHIETLDAAERLADARKGPFAERPDGVLASFDMYFAA